MNLLETYVASWRQSANVIFELCTDLTDEQWALPTDCPGWTVREVVAHLAHLEYVTAGGDDVDRTELTGAVVSSYTEVGVEARRDRTPQELLEEMRVCIEKRVGQLDPLPADPNEIPTTTPGRIQWSWDTLLRNRAIDMWVHEQDLRRALRKPGGMDSQGAHVAAMTFAAGMPFALGKKIKAPAGTSVVWTVSGEIPIEVGAAVGEDGRGHKVDPPPDPSIALAMSTEAFTILAAGRQPAADLDVTVAGDPELGATVLAKMAVTP